MLNFTWLKTHNVAYFNSQKKFETRNCCVEQNFVFKKFCAKYFFGVKKKLLFKKFCVGRHIIIVM